MNHDGSDQVGRWLGQARYRVLALLCLAATIAYICRNSIGVAESTIRRDLNLDEDDMAWVMSAFFLTYALGQIPSGWIGGRWGSRIVLPILAITWSWFTGLVAFAMGIWLLVLSRLAIGAAQAGLFPCATTTVAAWFPSGKRATANGLLASFMSIGGALGAIMTGILLVSVGWRIMFLLYSVLGVVWACVFYGWFRNRPDQHAEVTAEELAVIRQQSNAPSSQADPTTPHATPWLALFTSPATFWICGQQFFRAAGQMFFGSWFATYLQETRSVSVQNSGLLSALPLLGIVAGAFIGGNVSDFVLARTGNLALARKGVATCCLLACAVFVALAFFITNPWLAVLTISAGTFCAAIGGPCAYTITIDMGGKHVSTLFATMNMCGNFGALAFIHGVPQLLSALGNNESAWHFVLLLFCIMYIGAAACWAMLRVTETVFEQSPFFHPETETDGVEG